MRRADRWGSMRGREHAARGGGVGRGVCALFAVLAVGFFLLGGCSKKDEYPQSVRDEFMTNCLRAATESLKSNPRASEYGEDAPDRFCRCALEKITAKVSLKDFIMYENALKIGDKPDPAMARTINEQVTECQVKLLKGK